MDRDKLHEAAYAIVRPQFEEEKRLAAERVEARLGSGDGRVVIALPDVVEAARAGRIETLLLAEGADNPRGPGASEDPFEAALVETLRHGGEVRTLADDSMPEGAVAAALLRY